jgi:NADH-quinone oxidoreductase subunit M
VLPEGAAAVAPWLGALGVVGIVYGSLACLAKRDLKRLVAFSSVGHMGFVLLGIATLTPVGINGALYANVAHGVITGLLFFLVGGVKERHGTTDLSELPRSLYARAPRLGGLLALAAVASLGLPGLAGFWGEFLAMTGAFRPADVLHRAPYLVLLAVAAVGTVLTTYYLLRMVRRVDQGDGTGPAVRDVDGVEAVAWLPLAALTVLLGLLPGVLLTLSTPAVSALLGAGP